MTAEAPARSRHPRLAAARRLFVDYATTKGREVRQQAELEKVYSTLVGKFRTDDPQRLDGITSSQDTLRLDYNVKGRGHIVMMTHIPRDGELPEQPAEIIVQFPHNRDHVTLKITRDDEGKYAIGELSYGDPKTRLTMRNRSRTDNLLHNLLPHAQT